jgi:hypothetical protein
MEENNKQNDTRPRNIKWQTNRHKSNITNALSIKCLYIPIQRNISKSDLKLVLLHDD